jgi:hypothetical protein
MGRYRHNNQVNRKRAEPFMQNSLKKHFVNYCAMGDIDGMSKLIDKHPNIIWAHNPSTGNSPLYYSVRNLKLEAAKLLIGYGLTLDIKEILWFISHEWKASIKSYVFMCNIGSSIFDRADIGGAHARYLGIQHGTPSDNKPIKGWLLEEYIKVIFENSSFDILEEIHKIEGIKPDVSYWHETLNDFKIKKGISIASKNLNAISMLRSLELKILLDDI